MVKDSTDFDTLMRDKFSKLMDWNVKWMQVIWFESKLSAYVLGFYERTNNYVSLKSH